jgi:ParB-like chromosome segregation protein Spo0J
MKYKHEFVHPSKLAANPWNSNIVSAENEVKIDASIQRLGIFKPILVRDVGGELQILGGQHRWESAIRLGLSEIPIVNLGVISDEKAKEIGLVDNGRYGVDDATLLSNILKSLGEPDELADFLPFSLKEMNNLFEATSINLDDLDISDEDDGIVSLDTATSSGPTHQIMRFKVPVEDAERISVLVERTMKEHEFTASDALTNAGDALVHLLQIKKPA